MLNRMRLGIVVLLAVFLGISASPLVAQSDLRTQSFGPQSDFAEITFIVNPGDVSVLFYARAADPSDNVLIVELVGPGGEILYQEDENTGEIFGDMFTDLLISRREAALYMPPAPQFELAPGEYSVVVLTENESNISDAGIIVKSGNVNGPQAIDFNLLILTNNITASDYDNIETNLRSEMNSILSPHNLQVGSINFEQGTASEIQQFSSTLFPEEDLINEELLDICELTNDVFGATRALNIAFVDAVGDDSTAGISTGLPGSPMVDDSPISCVVAALQGDTDFANNTQGINVLHEGSHLMGMVHTTEAEGTFFDLFNDTPECPADQFDDNGDGEVDDIECASRDGRNYMFWLGGGLEMSDDQAWTLRRHPLFYPVSAQTTPPSTTSDLSIEKAIDKNTSGVIEDTEIKGAIQYWVLGEAVPGTADETIGDTAIMNLIRQWVTGERITS